MAYPGQHHHHHGYQANYGPPQGSPYGPPSGPWNAPPGPPPGGYPPPPGSPYAQPSGPPPGHYGGYGQPTGPPPGQHRLDGHPTSGGAANNWAPPTGPPPFVSDNTRPYSGPNNGLPPQNYQQAHYQPRRDPNDPYFEYSNCSGRRKALCIGINYVGTSAELRGCHNDAMNVQRFLSSRYGYKQEDIVMLMDTPSANSRQIPTRANMIAAMEWLVKDARPNDSLFFHYSGHGGQAPDPTGMEDDGMNETICPLDFRQAGEIIDDELNYIMVRPLPPGCRLTAIFDSCHSGTALDLPYVYSTEGKIKDPTLFEKQDVMKMGMDYIRGNRAGAAVDLFKIGKQAFGANSAAKKAKAQLTFPCDAIQWSGCKDAQTSADAQEAGQATGAMSYAFIRALSENPNQTYQSLLVHIRGILRDKYQQRPQLSSSHPMDTNMPYVQ